MTSIFRKLLLAGFVLFPVNPVTHPPAGFKQFPLAVWAQYQIFMPFFFRRSKTKCQAQSKSQLDMSQPSKYFSPRPQSQRARHLHDKKTQLNQVDLFYQHLGTITKKNKRNCIHLALPQFIYFQSHLYPFEVGSEVLIPILRQQMM